MSQTEDGQHQQKKQSPDQAFEPEKGETRGIFDTKEQYQQRINKQIDKQIREKQKQELDAEI